MPIGRGAEPRARAPQRGVPRYYKFARLARESTNSDSGTRRARINGNGLGRLDVCGAAGNGLPGSSFWLADGGVGHVGRAFPRSSEVQVEQAERYRKDS